MTTLTITLPDEVAKIAQEKGLLSPVAISELVREAALREPVNGGEKCDPALPPGFDPRLKGKVSPELYGRGKIIGDIVGPFFEEWGEKP